MVKIYVAGKWSDKDSIGTRIRTLESLGYEITHNWTEIEDGLNYTESELAHLASWDIQGVCDADLVIFLFEDGQYAYRGTYTEFGCAIGSGKEILVVDAVPDGYYRSNIFFHLDERPGKNKPYISQRFESWEKLLDHLRTRVSGE